MIKGESVYWWWWWWWGGWNCTVCGCLSSCRAMRPSRGVLTGCLPHLDLVSVSAGACVCLRSRSPRLARPSQRHWRSAVKRAALILFHHTHRAAAAARPSCHSLPLETFYMLIHNAVLHDKANDEKTNSTGFGSMVVSAETMLRSSISVTMLEKVADVWHDLSI